jgi:hypothetical protein
VVGLQVSLHQRTARKSTGLWSTLVAMLPGQCDGETDFVSSSGPATKNSAITRIRIYPCSCTLAAVTCPSSVWFGSVEPGCIRLIDLLCDAYWLSDFINLCPYVLKWYCACRIREIGWEGVDWIHLAQDRDQWRAFVNTVMNLRVP